MAELTEKEIRKLNREIEKQGLTYTELQQELLDHLCCDVEAEMEEGLEFVRALEKVRGKIGKDRIQQIQEETLLLINQKYRIMKKFMYILGMIAPAMLITGTIFKIQHWPGAGVLLVLSLFLLGAIYLPAFVMVKIRDTRKKGKQVNMPMYIFGLIAGIIFIAGAMFKIQHWPGANIMIILSGIVTVFVFIPILVIQALKDKENQVQNFTILIFVLSFVAITFMIYALRVSKNVLTAFTVAAEGHINSTEIVEARNKGYLDQIELADPDSEAIILKAKEITARTDALDDYIQDMIVEIVVKSHPDNLAAVDSEGNILLEKVSSKDMVGSVEVVIFGDEGIPGKGKELKGKIDEYRDFLAKMADPELAVMIEKLLDTSPRGEAPLPWEEYCFRQTPMMAAVNLLTNIQTNFRIAEGEVLSQLLHGQLVEVGE
ncbi:MAG: hypothetical protein KAT31_14485 [Bacteroidales bacterium]|nr:hypothetical protein [Bacteroidales bacterium]